MIVINSLRKRIRTSPIILLILLSFCLRAGMAIYLGDTLDAPQQVRIFDQHSYDLLARSLLAGQGYSFEKDWYPFTPADTPTAHWSFLYPVFLAGIYAVAGFHPIVGRLVQILISSILITLLLYKLGRWLSGEAVGLVAAGLGAVYSYFILYDASLMTESFFILNTLLMFILSLKIAGLWDTQTSNQGGTDETPKLNHKAKKRINKEIGLWVLLGINLGILAMLRQTILLWVPFLFIYLVFYPIEGKIREAVTGSSSRAIDFPKIKTRLLGALISMIVLLIFILPFTIRNYIVYNAFLPLNSNAGYALYSSNHPQHGTHFVQSFAAPLPEGMGRLNEAQLNTQLTRVGLEFILSDPKRFLLLSLNRASIFFNFGFLPESTLVNNLIRTFTTGLYLPLFLLGIGISRHQSRRYLLFYSFAFVFSVMHLLSWSSIRYRLPIDALFLPFAALAIVQLMKFIPLQKVSRFIKKPNKDKLITGVSD